MLLRFHFELKLFAFDMTCELSPSLIMNKFLSISPLITYHLQYMGIEKETAISSLKWNFDKVIKQVENMLCSKDKLIRRIRVQFLDETILYFVGLGIINHFPLKT